MTFKVIVDIKALRVECYFGCQINTVIGMNLYLNNLREEKQNYLKGE